MEKKLFYPSFCGSLSFKLEALSVDDIYLVSAFIAIDALYSDEHCI